MLFLKVMDTTPAPPNYKGEPAEKWEELLPTPPDSDQDDQVEDPKKGHHRGIGRAIEYVILTYIHIYICSGIPLDLGLSSTFKGYTL